MNTEKQRACCHIAFNAFQTKISVSTFLSTKIEHAGTVILLEQKRVSVYD